MYICSYSLCCHGNASPIDFRIVPALCFFNLIINISMHAHMFIADYSECPIPYEGAEVTFYKPVPSAIVCRLFFPFLFSFINTIK